ncbi:MAG TPA: glycosyltransferase family 2 protein, partial [Candidatus Manganitrophaceae bacterium]|nr:glycosyltransferase family 2 protein [Candidatus Manganitrophaceae bacterium]
TKVHPSKEGEAKRAGRAAPKTPSFSPEIALTRFCLVLTVVVWTVATWELIDILRQRLLTASLPAVLEQLFFILLTQSLIYGNVVYQLTRLGALKRRAAHRPVSRHLLDGVYDEVAPPLTILVPSYKEEPSVIQRTLLSAALQDYPSRRVVLLIDNPPDPREPSEIAALSAARQLPFTIQSLLEEAATPFVEAYHRHLNRRFRGELNIITEVVRLVQLCYRAAFWFEKQAAGYPVRNHEDALFVEKIFIASAEAHRRRAEAIEQAASIGELSERQIQREYWRLAALFQVEVTRFERKRYINLSHEPNKAMNLNSYIGLIGKSFRKVRKEEALYLEEAAPSEAEWVVPDAEFIITLDADSLLSTDYALRLIHHMRQRGNERIAVAQTPYSAVPGAPGRLERTAGATTDIQYLIHQGFTYFNATFWVGANALLRKRALDDIRVTKEERGFPVSKYIQDRTVIEDTESSVDLVERGWTLYNYPERLAYSATPSDFGALLIQRRRWANGGLIILPKLIRYLLRGPGRTAKLIEGFFRCHYLASIAAVNIGLLILLALPFEGSIRTFWLPLTALPYFFLYGRDLVRSGYRATDFFRVYALNLLLIPVNLGGVIKSLHQTITGRQIPFGRTPKVTGRTAVPALYIFLEYGLFLYWTVGCVSDLIGGRWTHAVFGLVNLLFLGWALFGFIGLKESQDDLLRGFKKPALPEPGR